MTDLTLPFVYDPAQYPAELANVTHVTLHRFDNAIPRNDLQIQALAASAVTIQSALPGTDPLREQGHWYYVEEAAQNFRAINGEPIFQDKLFLFNLIISVEWRPTAYTLQEIRLAARRASDLMAANSKWGRRLISSLSISMMSRSRAQRQKTCWQTSCSHWRAQQFEM